MKKCLQSVHALFRGSYLVMHFASTLPLSAFGALWGQVSMDKRPALALEITKSLPIHLFIHLLTYPLMLLSSLCYNVFVTYLRIFSPSHPSRWLENRLNYLKRNYITKHIPPCCLPFQGICLSGCCSAGPSWVFLARGAVPSPLWTSSILVLLPSLRKMNREPHSEQEKVGAKRVKIAMEELFLPTPCFSSFFTASFAAFSTWAKENLHYLMPNFIWEKKVLPFFAKIKFLHLLCCPQSHGKN